MLLKAYVFLWDLGLEQKWSRKRMMRSFTWISVTTNKLFTRGFLSLRLMICSSFLVVFASDEKCIYRWCCWQNRFFVCLEKRESGWRRGKAYQCLSCHQRKRLRGWSEDETEKRFPSWLSWWNRVHVLVAKQQEEEKMENLRKNWK